MTLVASLLVATPALADSYSIDAVNIDAAVASDGTLSVTETRDFVFDGSYHGVYWKIPKGENSSNGKDVGITINYVGLLVNGQVQKFDLSNSGGNSTYQVSDYGSYYQVKLYSAQEDDTAQFVISYNATGIVTRWDDTGELYWKFVSDGWDVESQNVTCTVTLPVPAGETVTAGDNVRAWGHVSLRRGTGALRYGPNWAYQNPTNGRASVPAGRRASGPYRSRTFRRHQTPTSPGASVPAASRLDIDALAAQLRLRQLLHDCRRWPGCLRLSLCLSHWWVQLGGGLPMGAALSLRGRARWHYPRRLRPDALRQGV